MKLKKLIKTLPKVQRIKVCKNGEIIYSGIAGNLNKKYKDIFLKENYIVSTILTFSHISDTIYIYIEENEKVKNKSKKKKIKSLIRKYNELLEIFKEKERAKLYDSEKSRIYLADVKNAYRLIINDLKELIEGVENE